MWMSPEFEQLRDFVETASCNPATFPKNASTAEIVHCNIEQTSISNDFVLKIESGTVCNRNDINQEPILQITDVTTKFKKFTLNSCEHTHKQVTLQASENNGHCVTIKLASKLNDIILNMKTGTFIKLQQFQILR